MKIITIILIAVSLSMDAFSLSLIYGTQGITKKHKIILSLIVGAYHFIMPLLGVTIGKIITSKIIINTNLIVGIILILISIEMIISSLKKEEKSFLLTIPSYLIFGLSVSIDSLTTGIGLSLITNKYVVTGIQHVKGGDKVGTVMRIQYSYDENGVIHIQARQEQSKTDLPIRKESVPDDVSVFGRPIAATSNGNMGVQIGTSASKNVVHKYTPVTFSNVEWERYDRIMIHPSGAQYNEPKNHIIANEKNIEFHGYNVSQMNEGVLYTIGASDDFEIECDINTSKISPHPGGYLQISLGIISAQLDKNGGSILMDGNSITSVGSKFHLNMSLTNGGQYEVKVNSKSVGSKFSPSMGGVDVVFGFVHDSHCCELISHAYVSDISMMQRSSDAGDDNPDAETWDD